MIVRCPPIRTLKLLVLGDRIPYPHLTTLHTIHLRSKSLACQYHCTCPPIKPLTLDNKTPHPLLTTLHTIHQKKETKSLIYQRLLLSPLCLSSSSLRPPSSSLRLFSSSHRLSSSSLRLCLSSLLSSLAFARDTTPR